MNETRHTFRFFCTNQKYKGFPSVLDVRDVYTPAVLFKDCLNSLLISGRAFCGWNWRKSSNRGTSLAQIGFCKIKQRSE